MGSLRCDSVSNGRNIPIRFLVANRWLLAYPLLMLKGADYWSSKKKIRMTCLLNSSSHSWVLTCLLIIIGFRDIPLNDHFRLFYTDLQSLFLLFHSFPCSIMFRMDGMNYSTQDYIHMVPEQLLDCIRYLLQLLL